MLLLHLLCSRKCECQIVEHCQHDLRIDVFWKAFSYLNGAFFLSVVLFRNAFLWSFVYWCFSRQPYEPDLHWIIPAYNYLFFRLISDEWMEPSWSRKFCIYLSCINVCHIWLSGLLNLARMVGQRPRLWHPNSSFSRGI